MTKGQMNAVLKQVALLACSIFFITEVLKQMYADDMVPHVALLPTRHKIDAFKTVMKELQNGLSKEGQLRNCRDRTKILERIMTDYTGPGIKPDDPWLLMVLGSYVIDPPSPHLTKMSYPLFITPQAEAVDKILKNKNNGFFVECGGLDGERSSNTIFFEQERNWTGLIIEMDPSWYQQMKGKNRKSYTINACISPKSYPVKMQFREHTMGEGQLLKDTNRRSRDLVHDVYCFPFYSMMLALNRTKIDYFSLDVEGLELEVLKTIPFDLLDISVFSVEYKHGALGGKAYVDFMKNKGYSVH